MGSISIWHWLIVLLVVVMIFGTKKLRNIGNDLGGAVRGFKEGIKSGGEAGDDAATAAATPQAVAVKRVDAANTVDVEARPKV